MLGTYTLSAGYREAYYGRAQQVRRLIRGDFQQAFEKVDVIAAPVSPVLPFKLGEKLEDPVAMYMIDGYTIPVNLAGLPGLSLPARPVDGLPTAVQVIGNDFAEGRLLTLGAVLQRETDWHRAMPAAFA